MASEQLLESTRKDNPTSELTHIRLVLESKPASRPSAMEMRRPLPEERAVRSAALFSRSVPLEPLLDDSGVLPVVVGVHLHVRSRYVHLITALFDAMIVRLFLVVGAVGISIRTIV